MILARRATLRPSTQQSSAFGRACGAARWAWNWGLERKRAAWKIRKQELESGKAKNEAQKVPSAIDLHRELNLLKKKPAEEGGAPWMYEVSKCAPQEGLRDLDVAFEHFFRRLKLGETPGYPKFKSRRDPGHFRLTGAISVKNGKICLPRIGSVSFMPGDRYYIPDGTYSEASIVEDGGHWRVSVRLNIEPQASAEADLRPMVGLDVGVRELAHLSDGTILPNPMASEKESRRLRKSRLVIARKQRAADKKFGKRAKGQKREESKRLQRERKRARRLARRVAHLRTDALHKATTWLAKNYRAIAVEDLSGKNMTRACRGPGRAAKAGLNRAILDSGMLKIKPLLAYKMPLYGGQLILVPAAYTSQTCSRCQVRNDPGSSKTYSCASCGLVVDRDENASLNILAAASCTAEQADFGQSARRGADGRPKAKAGRQSAQIRQSEAVMKDQR